MADQGGVMTVEIGLGADRDDAELVGQAIRLRASLLELDVESVELLRELEVPAGSKGLEALAIGKLVVQVARSRQAILRVVKALHAWVSRGDERSVVIEIGGNRLELSRASLEDQRQLIDHWIAQSHD